MSLDYRMRVLSIDDEKDNNMSLTMNCEDKWDITTFETPAPLFNKEILLSQFDTVFLDMVFNEHESLAKKIMAEPSSSLGIDTLNWVRNENLSIPIFVISALYPDQYKPRISKKYTNVFYLQKPLCFNEEFKVQVEAIVYERKRDETN